MMKELKRKEAREEWERHAREFEKEKNRRINLYTI